MRKFPIAPALLAFSLGLALQAPRPVWAETTVSTATPAPVPAVPDPGKLRVCNLFGDHAVLQREEEVPIWGWDEPGQAVTVTYGSQKASAKADEKGKWTVKLNLDEAGAEPAELVVEGSGKVISQDVIVGEIWIASGQSNMEWKLSKSISYEEEKAAMPYPNLRMWHAAYVAVPEPQAEVKGQWEVLTPENIGKFSGVAFHFAKQLNQELKEPIGVVHSHWGGTPAEAWTSAEGLAKLPEVDEGAKKILAKYEEFPQLLAKYAEDEVAWIKANAREDHAKPEGDALTAFVEGPTDGEEWKTVKPGANLAEAGLPEAGAIWFRKTVELNEEQAKWVNFQIAPLAGLDSFYVNGKLVKEMTWATGGVANQREYGVAGNILKAGPNEIALRVYVPGKLTVFGENAKFSQILWNDWKAKAEYALDPLSAEVLATEPKCPQNLGKRQNAPSHLYNGMIEPLVPVAFRGVIWYQGESNAGRAQQYREVFPNMIQDWRAQWGGRNFPFYFCQLANYLAKSPQPGNSGWAETREAQEFALKLPNTGEAILIDLGEEGDIHPRNKKDVGLRLARIALAKTYGKDVVHSGPLFSKLEAKEGKVTLTFTEVAGGLVAQPLPATYKKKSLGNEPEIPLELPVPDSELQGFAVCASDGVWKWASAKITGKNTIELSSPEVAEPAHVRYAWSNNPTCNLYNSEGLPAGPFRTDDFPLTSIGKLGQP